LRYSLIIPAYNEEKLLPSTLNAINRIVEALRGEHSGEVIVVDNNSTDATAEIAEDFGAEVVFAERNCIAVARNAGASAAKGEILIFVDADTIPPKELIASTLNLAARGDCCGGGALIEFDRDDIPLPLRVFKWMWETHASISPMAAGSYIFCLKKAWEETGGFDESVYASEEVWFSMALRKWGRKRGMKFKIIDIPVVTSARKLEQYSLLRLLSVGLILTVFPWGVRNKNLCRVWYERD
jgi:glycosyltransferase involved in cell wall biosynthesis